MLPLVVATVMMPDAIGDGGREPRKVTTT